ncbi:MAG: molybdopterin-dependent oxidoreductase [Pyrinomonadaceae bacterium]|nr:molybdopterin-dependent oxidoreductase [Pyrinomonadaceae bacterium]
MNEKNTNEQNGKDEKQTSSVESEVLVEKVREIELAKEKSQNSEARNLDKNNTSKILNEKRELSEPLEDAEAKRRMSQKSRRGFLVGGAAALVGVFGWRWMPDETKEKLLRRTFEFNERVSQIFYSPKRLAPEFARERVGDLRVNGGEGMSEDFNPQTWRLQVVGLANPRGFSQYTDNIAYDTAMDNNSSMRPTNQLHENKDAKQNPNAPAEMPPATEDRAAASQMPMPGLLLTLDDIKKLPRVEMTTELKCIEGWSVGVNWAGARLSDFMNHFQPATRDGSAPDIANKPENLLPYISMVTPDGGYYVGIDMPSAMHPQTLLCYEMNGAPLTMEHGAPLRLVTPTKYGIKQIKRIGRIAFTNERPADYWAERGYDWYAGH